MFKSDNYSPRNCIIFSMHPPTSACLLYGVGSGRWGVGPPPPTGRLYLALLKKYDKTHIVIFGITFDNFQLLLLHKVSWYQIQ